MSPRENSFTIKQLSAEEFDAFISYMNAHLAENGSSGYGYFQPLPRSAASFPQEKQAGFRAGLDKSVRESGWRRTWLACLDDGKVIGHIDLRGYPDPYTDHRCLLGMGVSSENRRQGIGKELLQCAIEWAKNDAYFEWIDLQVISSNKPAISLYQEMGFKKIGEISDLFRIDGKKFAYTTMTISFKNENDQAN